MKSFRIIAGVILLGVGFFDIKPNDIIDIIPWNPTPPPIVIVEPDQELKDLVVPVADLITDKSDRIMVAVFHDELADRVLLSQYDDIKLQTLNDVITEANRFYYEGSLSGKYKGLGDGIERLIISEAGEDDVVLSEETRKNLNEVLKAFVWALTN